MAYVWQWDVKAWKYFWKAYFLSNGSIYYSPYTCCPFSFAPTMSKCGENFYNKTIDKRLVIKFFLLSIYDSNFDGFYVSIFIISWACTIISEGEQGCDSFHLPKLIQFSCLFFDKTNFWRNVFDLFGNS